MGEATDQMRRVDDYDDPTTKTPSAGPAPSNDVDQGGLEAAQIRSGIEQTRADLSETIDALQEKLDPARIAEQVKDQIRDKASEAYDSAKSKVREATIGRAEKIMSNVSETVNDMTGRAGTAVKDTSSSLVQYIRDNPIPFALLGLGVGMLALNKRRHEDLPYASGRNIGSRSYYSSQGDDWDDAQTRMTGHARNIGGSGVADSAREAAANVADTARAAADRAKGAVTSAASTVRDVASSAADSTRQQFNQVSDSARQGARVASDRFNSTLKDNPIALGVAALAAGALVGLSLPTTRVEGEYMGEARDRLVDQAKSVAHEAAEKVQRVTGEAGRTLKDAAQKEGLTIDQSTNSSTA